MLDLMHSRQASARPTLRTLAVGDLLPSGMLRRKRTRRLDATAILLPGHTQPAEYRRELDRHLDDFAAWDGDVVILDADGAPDHLVVVVDRYGQVYESVRAPDASALPSPGELEAWFRFLATACPECGVLDDPRRRDWVP